MNTTADNITAPHVNLRTVTESTDIYPMRTTVTLEGTTSHMDDTLGEVAWHDQVRVQVSTLGYIQLSVSGYGGSTHYTPMPDMSGANAHAVAGMTPAEARAIAIALLNAADAAQSQD